MKLSFVVPSETSIDGAPKRSMEKRISLLSDLGYDGVELAVRKPQEVDAALLRKMLSRASLEVNAIGTGLAYLADGLSLSSPAKSIRQQAVSVIKKHIDLAEELDSCVIIGLVRGKLEKGEDESRCRNNLRDSMRSLCDYASSKAITLLLEPINRYETSFLNTAEETLTFIGGMKCGILKIMLDMFHMNIEEKDMLGAITKTGAYLGHIHLADSNRRCPGEGHIAFKPIIAHLGRFGYDGYLSGELMPPTDDRCVKRFFKIISPYIKRRSS